MAKFINKEADNIWYVQSDLDVYSVGDVLKEAEKLLRSEKDFSRIDLSQVKKIDSAGLAFIIELMKTAKRNKKKLYFKNIPVQMRTVAEVYGLSSILPESIFQH